MREKPAITTEQSPRSRRGKVVDRAMGSAAGLIMLATPVAFAVETATADASLATNRVEVGLHYGNNSTGDSSWGTVTVNRPVFDYGPIPIGVEARVGEFMPGISGDFTNPSFWNDLGASASAAITGVGADIDATRHALLDNFLKRLAIGEALAVGGLAAYYFAMPKTQRHRAAIALSGSAVLSAAFMVPVTVEFSTETPSVADMQQVTSVFEFPNDLTVTVTGPLGVAARSVYNQWEQMQTDAAAFQQHTTSEIRTALSAPEYQPDNQHTVLTYMTDNHCNIAMLPVVGEVAQAAGATIMVNNGDATDTGSEIEGFCVTPLMRQMAESGIATVFTPGNHDDETTASQAEAAGAMVPDGVVTVGDLTIYARPSPYHTELGNPTPSFEAEALAAQAAEVRDDLCAMDAPPDIVIMHQPEAIVPAAADDCLPSLTLTGHAHVSQPDWTVTPRGSAIYNGNNTSGTGAARDSNVVSALFGGGTVFDKLGIGVPTRPVLLPVFWFNNTTKEVDSYYEVVVFPDGSVEVSPVKPLPSE